MTYVDVFSGEPYRGNPVAVIRDAESLTDDTMHRIARWTNLSETVFMLAPSSGDAHYRVRIFTPTNELPFAGHPTLGAAHAWLEQGGELAADGTLVQECGAGLVTLHVEDGALAFAAPPLQRTGPLETDYLARLVDALGVTHEQVVAHQWVDNGPGWAAIQLASAAEVLALEPDLSLIPDAMLGVVGAHPAGSRHAFELRAFAPAINVPEDPVTGSLNASVAQWLAAKGGTPERYTVSQGGRVQRTGELRISATAGAIWVGGHTETRFTGTARV